MLKIRSESRPDRCEICHQSDQLDSASGECARCRDITVPDDRTRVELKDWGLAYRFTSSGLTRLVAAGVAASFALPVIGVHGVALFTGLIVFLKGLARFMEDKELLGRPALDRLLNIAMLWSGLAAFFWALIYFLRVSTR